MTFLDTQTKPIVSGVNALVGMISWRRPAFSTSEEKWINKWLRPLGLVEDKFGNLIKLIPNADGTDPIVLWSGHTDTVHNQGGQQGLEFLFGVICLSKREKISNCLGADNTAGVWLMRELILAGKPGLYIFHRAEETGGQGSGFLVKNTPELVEGIEIAIAFDRRGTTSIITHQASGRCCSDEFGTALAKAISPKHKLDSGGTFTDTANYTDLIGECTNISVGFTNEHRQGEALDVDYLQGLLAAMLALDPSTLPLKRKAGEVEKWPDYDYDFGFTSHRTPGRYSSPNVRYYDQISDWNDPKLQAPHRSNLTLENLCRMYPAAVASQLEECGFDVVDFAYQIYELYGDVVE